ARLAPLVPLACVLGAALIGVLVAGGPPDRLEPARAWCAPSLDRPLGCGEAGVDLFPLVAHALLRGSALAAIVAVVGFVAGTPLGAAAALARGRFERGVGRACDLI